MSVYMPEPHGGEPVGQPKDVEGGFEKEPEGGSNKGQDQPFVTDRSQKDIDPSQHHEEPDGTPAPEQAAPLGNPRQDAFSPVGKDPLGFTPHPNFSESNPYFYPIRCAPRPRDAERAIRAAVVDVALADVFETIGDVAAVALEAVVPAVGAVALTVSAVVSLYVGWGTEKTIENAVPYSSDDRLWNDNPSLPLRCPEAPPDAPPWNEQYARPYDLPPLTFPDLIIVR